MGIKERKEREKQQRREDIIDAAERIFFSKGLDNATMDDVAKFAELSKGTLYLYFKNKLELQLAICRRALLMLKGMFEKVIDPLKTSVQNLIEVGNVYVEYAFKHENYFNIMMHFESFDSNILNKFKLEHTIKDDVLEVLYNILEKGKNEGIIRNDIPTNILTHILWAQTTGMLQFMTSKKMILEVDSISSENLINYHLDILINGIKANMLNK